MPIIGTGSRYEPPHGFDAAHGDVAAIALVTGFTQRSDGVTSEPSGRNGTTRRAGSGPIGPQQKQRARDASRRHGLTHWRNEVRRDQRIKAKSRSPSA
jgi:hypothetical protein